jgi:prepilin-type N-terminal cleavage/methylation domain-containing protein
MIPEAKRPKIEFHQRPKNSSGFTLMEIVVATAIFAVVVTAMMALFNYTLKINRRTEALRQATQGMRNFVEYIVKIVRNGQIDYGVNPDHSSLASSIGSCPRPTSVGNNTYAQKENTLGLYDDSSLERLCLYLGNSSGTYVGAGVYAGQTLVLEKAGGFKQILNPPNFSVENLIFYIRPRKDPYVTTGGLARVQPFVSIVMKVVAKLPTGEIQPIYYQTTISSDKYDIPNN